MANQQKPDLTGSGFSAAVVAADGTRYELTGEQTLGRSDEADITIAHPKISRKHARFKVTGQQLTVEDLGSANGTRVNQRRIDGVVELGDGDVLSFDVVDLTVALTGVIDEGDATIVSFCDDATVVGSLAGAASDKPAEAPHQALSKHAIPEPPKPQTQSGSARTAEPPPPAPQSKSAPAFEPAVPGSWVDQAIGEHTQVLSGLEAAERTGAELKPERASDLPHLVIILKSGTQQVLELEPGGGEQPDVWEIGRDQACQIPISEDSVSSRHAQLIHQNGRWRLVNLVSTNGIYVNGNKRLTAYLADGDEIKLGTAALVFRTGSAEGAARAASGKTGDGAGGQLFKRLALVAGVAAAIVGLWVFLR